MADEIHRIVKQRDYVVIDKRIFHNEELSWKAKGIMGYVLTLPDDWTFRLEEIITHSKDKRDSFRAGWAELQEHGYVRRVPVRDESGRIKHWETHVFECPSMQNADIPDTENPLMEGNTATNRFSVTINGKSTCGKASDWKNQTLDNPTLLSIEKELSIDITNSTATTTIADVYTQVFGTFNMTPLFREYIKSLKDKGVSEELIKEAMLEAAESGTGKPNQRFIDTIITRWIEEGISSREEAKARKERKAASAPQQRSRYNRPADRAKPDIVPATPPPAAKSSTVSQSEYEEAMELARMMDQS